MILCYITGLPVSQPNYPGPGDPDRTLPAYNCAATRGGGVPVLPQRLGPARLPLQSSPRSNRDPCRECLFQPESMHRKHSEVWIILLCSLRIFFTCHTLQFKRVQKGYNIVFFPSRACLGLPPQNHMLLEHKLQRNFLPQHTTCTNGNKAAFKKIGLANGNHNPLNNGFSAHVGDVTGALWFHNLAPWWILK